MACEIVSILYFGPVERVGELESATWDLHFVCFGNADVLFAGVVQDAKSDIVDDIREGGYIMGGSWDFDLSVDFIESSGDLWCTS